MMSMGTRLIRWQAFNVLWCVCEWPAYGHDSPSPRSREEQNRSRSRFLNQILEDYDPRVPPNFDSDDSTVVSINVFISSFDSVSESTMDYLISMFLRQTWEDDRLNYAHLSEQPVITLDSRMVASLWVPDLFFTNEKKAHFHDITVPNRYIRIYRNGTIQYSARLSLTLSCPMKLQKFPLDTQICSIQFESYAYTLDKIQFKWQEPVAVEISQELEFPQFQMEQTLFRDCTKTYSTGSFTCLEVNFVLKRDIGFYMIQTYVPSALIVILSWVSFWINVDAIPARISLGVLTILTMTTQTTGSRQALPRVSYVKAIDVWMATCLIFVFAALLEFAIVNVLSRKEVRRMVTIRRQSMNTSDQGEVGVAPNRGRLRRPTFQLDPEGRDKARLCDKFSRRAFPVVFIVFNVVYWTSYYLWNQEPAGHGNNT